MVGCGCAVGLAWLDEVEMIIKLPWPPTGLSPNSRNHWAKTAKLKKQYREACFWQAMEQGARPIQAASLHLTLTFYPPTRRAYDLDNALARIKAGLDGLAGTQAVLAGAGWLLLGTLTGQPTVGLLGLLLLSANAAFLAHNWPPARILTIA